VVDLKFATPRARHGTNFKSLEQSAGNQNHTLPNPLILSLSKDRRTFAQLVHDGWSFDKLRMSGTSALLMQIKRKML
jgi:hypothetical protein